VVIAILALLIAILLPSLESARRQAKQATCLTRVRNIATSSQVYSAEDPNGWTIPVHPLQYLQDRNDPTYIGAYEWGGKSGIGRQDYVSQFSGTLYGSKYGTAAGFGPATRPLNRMLYAGGFQSNYDMNTRRLVNRLGAEDDTRLELDFFKCPADDGPPRGAHCPDWVENADRSSYDHFGTSFAANIFMVWCGAGCQLDQGFDSGEFGSNSPYLRPFSRVSTPARTIYFEENIGRWAWACRREWCSGAQPNGLQLTGVEPGITKAVRGWHRQDWTYNRSFVDGHAEYQKIYIAGSEDKDGYALHYRSEMVHNDPVDQLSYACVAVRGDGWQKDTLPSPLIRTGLQWPEGTPRPSYEDCVEGEGGGN
jgi:type II secretory pathway pseudopilin PulG